MKRRREYLSKGFLPVKLYYDDLAQILEIIKTKNPTELIISSKHCEYEDLEDLRKDALGTMRRIYSALEIPVDERELSRAVEKRSWENMPERKKGSGTFLRKATPGGWADDLTPQQAKTIERITAPLLKEFYSKDRRL